MPPRCSATVQADQSPGVVLTAPVTGISTSVLISRLTLGKGARDGVLQNMVATVPQGLVGMVTETATGSSVVRVVTDPQSRVGVTVSGRGGQGVAVGLPGGTIRVIDFIESEPVRVGDRVETSSLGGLYPRGVLVGTVVEVRDRSGDISGIEIEEQGTLEVPCSILGGGPDIQHDRLVTHLGRGRIGCRNGCR